MSPHDKYLVPDSTPGQVNEFEFLNDCGVYCVACGERVKRRSGACTCPGCGEIDDSQYRHMIGLNSMLTFHHG